MGIFRPGGPGTALNVYDNNDGTGGHAIGSPHTWGEINTAFPLEFALMQTAAGATFVGRPQYYCVVDLTIGDPGGGGNFTSLVDTNVDIYSPVGSASQSRLRFGSVASAGATTMQLGTKIGTGTKSDGKAGCAIYTGGAAAIRFRCNLALYGCFISAGGAIQFNTAGTSTGHEIAGCKMQAGNSYVLGDGGVFNIYNSSLAYTGTGAFMTNAVVTDSFGTILSATAPSLFFSSSAIGTKSFNRLTLNGAVTTADFRLQGSASGWQAADLTFSETPGLPRVLFTSAHSVTQGFTDYRTIDTKVVDPAGLSLQAIPVSVTSDIDGLILDTQTGADGNIVFTWTMTGVANVLPVREYYDAAGTGTIVRDRVYTMTVNGYGGTFAPNPNYKTRRFVFRWAGRDRLGSGYQVDGGSFQKILDVIQLSPGSPTRGVAWEECDVAGP